MSTNVKYKDQLDLQLPLVESNSLDYIKASSFYATTYKESVAKTNGMDMLQIHSRRYLGNKSKLLNMLKEIVKHRCGTYSSFIDIFAGTGVVGNAFNGVNIKIISNELLYSNFISLYAWLSSEPYDREKISGVLKQLNSITDDRKDNYVSHNFGNKYFSVENAKKIGLIREQIERLALGFKEKSILLTSLLYAIDKVANTCGHYDAFRKVLDTTSPIKLLLPDIKQENNIGNEIFNNDANKLIRDIEGDILYIDPPYNSRQYSDTYHLLENIISWKKPDVYGKAGKMNRGNIKSMYCTKEATKAFQDLIVNAKCKHILVSYNNMQNKGNGRSNARITDGEILAVLKNKGAVEVYEQEYRPFTTGKSIVLNHSERVFYCKVTK